MEEEIESSNKNENKIQDGPITIQLLSKDLIIICLYKEIQIYKINKNSLKKINTITLKKNYYKFNYKRRLFNSCINRWRNYYSEKRRKK